MDQGESTPLLVVPQRQALRSLYLASATLTYIIGVLGGVDDSLDARWVWWFASGIWFLRFFWTLSVPYIRLTGQEMIVAQGPFSQAGVSVHGTFDFEVSGSAKLVLRHGDGIEDRVSLRGLSEATRAELLLGLRRLQIRAASREQMLHEQFVSTWGVNPEDLELREDSGGPSVLSGRT